MTIKEMFAYFQSVGMTADGIYALLGNWEKESSGLKSNNAQNGSTKLTDEEYTLAADAGTIDFIHDSVGYGLAQWTFWSRKKELLDFAKTKGVSVGDKKMQCEFAVHEMKTSKKQVWAAVIDPQRELLELVTIICTEYEKPAVNNIGARYNEAKRYKKMLENTIEKNDNMFSTVEEAKKAYISALLGEVGYLEKKSNNQLEDKTANAGSNNFNKYADYIDKNFPDWYNYPKNGFEWCNIFPHAVAIKLFGLEKARKLFYLPRKSSGAGCRYSANYFRANKKYFQEPMVGDEIYFGQYGDEGHTGIVVDIKGDMVYTVEGNTSGGTGIVANGGGVYRKSYNKQIQYIPGYGRLNWAAIVNTTTSPEKEDVVVLSRPTISYGYKGEYVKQAQKLLFEKNYDIGTYGADGDFGLATLNAVRKFQSDNGLDVDGIIGPQTWAALEANIDTPKEDVTHGVVKPEENTIWNKPKTSVSVKLYYLEKGIEHEQVKLLQDILKSIDYYSGEIDGKFGENTKRSVMGFQADNSLDSDGKVGAITWGVLIEKYKFKEE